MDTQHVRYTVHIIAACKASCRSPFSGVELTAYGDDITDARRKLDVKLFAEAARHGVEMTSQRDDEEAS